MTKFRLCLLLGGVLVAIACGGVKCGSPSSGEETASENLANHGMQIADAEPTETLAEK